MTKLLLSEGEWKGTLAWHEEGRNGGRASSNFQHHRHPNIALRDLVNIPSMGGALRDGNCDGVVYDEQEESVVCTSKANTSKTRISFGGCYENAWIVWQILWSKQPHSRVSQMNSGLSCASLSLGHVLFWALGRLTWCVLASVVNNHSLQRVERVELANKRIQKFRR